MSGSNALGLTGDAYKLYDYVLRHRFGGFHLASKVAGWVHSKGKLRHCFPGKTERNLMLKFMRESGVTIRTVMKSA